MFFFHVEYNVFKTFLMSTEVALYSYHNKSHSSLVGPKCSCCASEGRNRSCAFGFRADNLPGIPDYCVY